ncbi:protein of unknown function [Aquiflexum balticum DSM 16537]|uniref:DUF4221 domain-containing protein n=1 Tax=Aquiflexum balticum DSM 16537 TaxID=758820 RepID=A0A1W2HB53_9BACT|nr:DUF4221 family protein [Aquiflexum balticum]SMD46130.1 protein of unknown function [Aquiflexum balticum DSM 16537]
MKIVNLILLSILTLFSFSCSRKFENKIELGEPSHDLFLESEGLIKFEAINGLNSYLSSIQFFEDSTSLVGMLNPLNNTFFWFDLESGKWLGNQVFEEEGPNGVGFLGGVTSSFILNQDSILIYNIQVGRLFLLNKNSEILDRYIVTDYSDPSNFPAPFPSLLRPIQYYKGKVILPSGLNNRISNFENFPSSLTLDLKTKKVKFPSIFSDLYSQAYWGEMFKYDPSVISFQDKLIISYPIDFSLHVLDWESDSVYKVMAPSNYFDNIVPFKYDVDYYSTINPNQKNIEQENHSLSTSDFAGLLADPNGEFLYRIAYIRPNLEQVRLGNKLADFSTIIIDSELKIVGERKFDGKIYDNSLIFTSPKGIHIFRKDLYEMDEQYLSFETFQPKKI